MRNVFIFFAFLIAGMAHAQIITNVDKLRIRDVERGLESDKILVIDSSNVVRWIDAIEVDLSDYYTISEVDTFVADLEAELLERYTKDEVDALLDGLELRLDDYYTKTEVDSIITNINDRIDNIDLNTVTSVDNVTSIKIRGSDIFTNNLETDFAQIADVNKAGFGLISMQSEMKIGLVAKDGTTLLDDVDVSWLASGDLAVTIDDTDTNNPELVFSQGGVEVARIPASTLLAGVARSANLSNYILQFKDGTGAVVYSVNLEPLFEDYFTKAEANARFALRTRTITAGNGLTGGGNLTANRTIALSTDTQNDIGKGVTAHGWGNHADENYATETYVGGAIDDIEIGGRNYLLGTSEEWRTATITFYNIYPFGGSSSSPTITDVEEGESYVFSVRVRPDNQRARLHVRFFNETGSVVGNIYSEFIDSEDEGRLYLAFTVPENAVSFFVAIRREFNDNESTTVEYKKAKLEKGNKATDWTPAPEDQVTDWNETNPESYSFLKNKPTDLATQNWVNSQGFINDLSNYYTKNEALNQFVGLSGVQDISDTKTFLASPVVPNPTLDAHAVNRGWVEEVTKLNHARYQTDSQSLATSGFIEFNGTPDFTSSYITQLSNKYEFQVEEDGFYEITLSWRSAFGQVYFLDFEINGSSKIINSFNGGGQVFQYTYREYLNEGDLFRIRSDNEIQSVKCTLYIKNE